MKTRITKLTRIVVALTINALIVAPAFSDDTVGTQLGSMVIPETKDLPAEVEPLIEKALTRMFDEKVSRLDPPTREAYARELGFDSAEQGQRAKPRMPFPIYHVRLDQLREYKSPHKPDAALRKLLIDTHSWILPLAITENGVSQIRSSATVVAIGKDQGTSFRLSEMTSPELVEQLTEARVEAKNSHPDKLCACFAIWIPALSRYFFGDWTTKTLMIKVLEDGPGELRKGFLSGEKVFHELSREAQNSRYDAPQRRKNKNVNQ